MCSRFYFHFIFFLWQIDGRKEETLLRGRGHIEFSGLVDVWVTYVWFGGILWKSLLYALFRSQNSTVQQFNSFFYFPFHREWNRNYIKCEKGEKGERKSLEEMATSNERKLTTNFDSFFPDGGRLSTFQLKLKLFQWFTKFCYNFHFIMVLYYIICVCDYISVNFQVF